MTENCKHCSDDYVQTCSICFESIHEVYVPYHDGKLFSEVKTHIACKTCWESWEKSCQGQTLCPMCRVDIDIRQFYDNTCTKCQSSLKPPRYQNPSQRQKWCCGCLIVTFFIVFFIAQRFFLNILLKDFIESDLIKDTAVNMLRNNRPLADAMCGVVIENKPVLNAMFRGNFLFRGTFLSLHQACLGFKEREPGSYIDKIQGKQKKFDQEEEHNMKEEL